jgi:hypothetical protein
VRTELPAQLRDNALRAIEQARVPCAPSRETAQANVARLPDTVPDDINGTLAQRILATGSPGYKRVFGKALASGNPGGLTGNDARILALGESDTGAFAVPFELDPTGDPHVERCYQRLLRQIARVERITVWVPKTLSWPLSWCFASGQGRTSSVSDCAMAMSSGTLGTRVTTTCLPRGASDIWLAGPAGPV